MPQTCTAISKQEKLLAWKEALRLRTLPLAASGCVLAGGLAFHASKFSLSIFVPMLLMAFSLQILSNFADELGDLINGIDDEDRLGPIRGLQRGDITKKEMIYAVIIAAVISNIFAVLCLLASFRSPTHPGFIIFFLIELLCILAAICYTVGPKPYGYLGLGDLSSFIFFGIVAVAGGSYLFLHELHLQQWIVATALGLPVIAVIHLNNMRDAQTDREKGKKTVANVLGDTAMRWYYVLCLTVSMILFMVHRHFISETILNPANLIGYFFIIAYLPWIKNCRYVFQIREPQKFDHLMKPTALTTVTVCLLYSISLSLF